MDLTNQQPIYATHIQCHPIHNQTKRNTTKPNHLPTQLISMQLKFNVTQYTTKPNQTNHLPTQLNPEVQMLWIGQYVRHSESQLYAWLFFQNQTNTVNALEDISVLSCNNYGFGSGFKSTFFLCRLACQFKSISTTSRVRTGVGHHLPSLYLSGQTHMNTVWQFPHMPKYQIIINREKIDVWFYLDSV